MEKTISLPWLVPVAGMDLSGVHSPISYIIIQAISCKVAMLFSTPFFSLIDVQTDGQLTSSYVLADNVFQHYIKLQSNVAGEY